MRFKMMGNITCFQAELDAAVRHNLVEGPVDPSSGSGLRANGNQGTNIWQYLIWELFSRHRLSCAIFYWQLSHGLRAAHATEPSRRPADGRPGQSWFAVSPYWRDLCAQFYTCVRSASRAFGPWKQLDD